MIQRGPLVRKRPRKRNRDGTWRKKRSDAGKKREKNMSMMEPSQRGIIPNGWHVDYESKTLNLKTNLAYIGLALTEQQLQYLRSQFDMFEEHFKLKKLPKEQGNE